MNEQVIAKAEEIINAKTGYIGGGMEGYAALALIDENGYPTASTITIAKADGIKWLTFCTSPDTNKIKRIRNNNRASVCINSDEYNITLVGTVEVLTDEENKKANRLPVMDDLSHWSGPGDPAFCVLRFTTESYNLYVGYEEAAGALSSNKVKAVEAKKAAPRFEPILIYKNGQCAKAMELYKKALGAEITTVMRYSESNPRDVGVIAAREKDFIYHAGMKIGKQTILLCDDNGNDDSFNIVVGNHIQIVLEFDCAKDVRSAYNAMLEGATNLTPPHTPEYSACAAYLTDAYGIPWQFMVWHG